MFLRYRIPGCLAMTEIRNGVYRSRSAATQLCWIGLLSVLYPVGVNPSMPVYYCPDTCFRYLHHMNNREVTIISTISWIKFQLPKTIITAFCTCYLFYRWSALLAYSFSICSTVRWQSQATHLGTSLPLQTLGKDIMKLRINSVFSTKLLWQT